MNQSLCCSVHLLFVLLEIEVHLGTLGVAIGSLNLGQRYTLDALSNQWGNSSWYCSLDRRRDGKLGDIIGWNLFTFLYWRQLRIRTIKACLIRLRVIELFPELHLKHLNPLGSLLIHLSEKLYVLIRILQLLLDVCNLTLLLIDLHQAWINVLSGYVRYERCPCSVVQCAQVLLQVSVWRGKTRNLNIDDIKASYILTMSV